MFPSFHGIRLVFVMIGLMFVHFRPSEAITNYIDLPIPIKKIIARNDTLWILADSALSAGNENGIFRFSLKDDSIEHVYAQQALDVFFDPAGSIHAVNTSGIVMKYDGVIWKGTKAVVWGDDLSSVIDYGLSGALALMTPDNTIWLGTWEEGLFTHKNDRWHHISGVDVGITSLAYGLSNDLWVGSFRGVYRYISDTWTHFTAIDGLPDNKIVVLSSKAGKTWAASHNRISVFENNKWNSLPENTIMDTYGILSLMPEINGHLWVGTNGGGVVVFDGSSWIPLTEPSELSNRHVSTITSYTDGKVCIGTSDGRIYFVTHSSTEVKHAADNLKSSSIHAVFPNPFNASTTIPYSIRNPGWYELAVYDILGRKITTLSSGFQEMGEHRIIWNGKADSGAGAASGFYFSVLKRGNEIISSIKLLLGR